MNAFRFNSNVKRIFSIKVLNVEVYAKKNYSKLLKVRPIRCVINQSQKCCYSQKIIFQVIELVVNDLVLLNSFLFNFQKSTKEVDVSTHWGNVKIQIFGDVSPNHKPILALHGFLDNSNSFMPLSNYLTKHGYYIIAVDLPGI